MSRTRVAICVLAVSAGSIAAVAPARAAFPGRPGLIVFSSTFSGNRDIFTMSSDGSNGTDLTNDPHADITPSWSADGARIAFASDRSGTFEIYVMNADGSGVTQVTHDAAQDDRPRFTPDGRSLVYESTRGGNREIRRIGVDGAGEVDLTRSRAADRAPAVSPSGRLVAFTRGGHVWVMTIDGKRQHRVTSGRGTQDEPTWAPSGGRLAYVSRPFASDTSIRSILANGTGPRALAPLLGFEQANPVWSPDGRSIVYQRCSIGFLGVPPSRRGGSAERRSTSRRCGHRSRTPSTAVRVDSGSRSKPAAARRLRRLKVSSS